MKLTRTIIYAIQATVEVAKARTNQPISCPKLAQNGNMPTRFLLQILRTLVSHGVLRSARGVGGGYYLSRSPNQITLLDIIGPFEEASAITDSQFTALSSSIREPVILALKRSGEAASRELERVTVFDLLYNDVTQTA